MKDYSKLAEAIISNVGGEKNIISVEHCTTRLRFKLYDESIANDETIKKMDGIVTVMKAGGQYQIVVGTHVPDVYAAVVKQAGIKIEKPKEVQTKKGNIVELIMDAMVAIVGTYIPLLTAGGLIKGVNVLLVIAGLYAADSGIYILLGALGDAFFKFMPIFLGYTAMKKFGGTPALGMLIGAILCYPTINGVDVNLFGYVVNATYTSTFLPVVFTCLLAAPLERFFAKKLPELIRTIFTPVFTLLIAAPIGYALIGPFANLLGGYVTQAIGFVAGISPVLAGFVFGGIYQILVVFGLHGLITLTVMTNVFSGVPDPITGFIGFASHAFTAMALAVTIKTKNKKVKELGIPATITGLFGVTEPIIYGIALANKKMLITASIGAAIGGALGGFFSIKCFNFTGSGMIALLGYINPNDPNSIVKILITWLITYAVSFILSFIFYKDPQENESSESDLDTYSDTVENKDMSNSKFDQIFSPLKGNVIPLSEVKDAAFAGGDLGKGIAIVPSEGKVTAPFDGIIRTLFPTKHAIGMVSDKGCEVLIHIGIDTVNLNGKYFDAKVKQGDHVKAGNTLLTFDLKAIENEGFNLETPIIVTNSNDYMDFIETNEQSVNNGDLLFTVIM